MFYFRVTNLEVFYNYPINDNIRITPLAQIVLDIITSTEIP